MTDHLPIAIHEEDTEEAMYRMWAAYGFTVSAVAMEQAIRAYIESAIKNRRAIYAHEMSQIVLRLDNQKEPKA